VSKDERTADWDVKFEFLAKVFYSHSSERRSALPTFQKGSHPGAPRNPDGVKPAPEGLCPGVKAANQFFTPGPRLSPSGV
jgi:hypothetical protein